jgi:hypothetical protein
LRVDVDTQLSSARVADQHRPEFFGVQPNMLRQALGDCQPDRVG